MKHVINVFMHIYANESYHMTHKCVHTHIWSTSAIWWHSMQGGHMNEADRKLYIYMCVCDITQNVYIYVCAWHVLPYSWSFMYCLIHGHSASFMWMIQSKYIWMSHVTQINAAVHMNESCHTKESVIYFVWWFRMQYKLTCLWVRQHIWMRHVAHMNVTRMNEACHTYEWGMSHVRWLHMCGSGCNSVCMFIWVTTHVWHI